MIAENPGFLPWLLVGTVPVLIHLLTLRSARRRELPTLRFLMRGIASQSRLFRLRDALLLALRCLALLSVVMVFVRPSLPRADGARLAESTAIAIVIDTSLSMNARMDGISALERARTLSERLLRQQDPAAQAYLIAAGAKPYLLNREQRADIPHALDRLRNLQPTQETCDSGAAVALAAEALANSKARSGSLYIVSDFQRANWSRLDPEALPKNVNLRFVDASAGEVENAGITSLSLRPATPRTGEPAQVVATVWNGSPRTRTLEVSLQNGAQTQRRPLALSAFSSGVVLFPVQFGAPGQYPVRAELPADALSDDDRRWVVANVRKSLKALLLTAEDFNAPESASLYIRQALSPAPDVPGSVQVEVVRPGQPLAPALAFSDALILCDSSVLPEARLREIAEYLRGGGAVVVFLATPDDAANVRALDRLGGPNERVPFLPIRRVDTRQQGRGDIVLEDKPFSSKLVRFFLSDEEGSFMHFRFYRYFLTEKPTTEAEVALIFQDFTPALAHRGFGRGTIVLCNFTPSPLDSNLRTMPMFVSLVHEIVKNAIAAEESGREIYPGGVALLPVSNAVSDVQALGPDGRPRGVALDRKAGSLLIEGLDRVGLYTVRSGGRLVGSVAVNSDSTESDLRAIDPRELRHQRAKEAPLLRAGNDPGLAISLAASRPLWPWFALAAALFLLAEGLVMRAWKPGTGDGVRPSAPRG